MFQKALLSVSISALLVFTSCSEAQGSKELDSARAEAAALRHEMKKLLNRIEALEKKATVIELSSKSSEENNAARKKEASVPLVLAGSDKVALKIGGQLNRTMRHVNDGDRQRLQHVENTNSNSYINMTGEGKFNSDLIVGGTWEGAMYDNNSYDTAIGSNPGNNLDSNTPIRSRVLEVYFNSTKFGKLSLGRGLAASDSTSSGADLSGVNMVSDGSNFDGSIGAVGFVNKETRQRMYAANSILDGVDGLPKLNRVRYDTPTFLKGFVLSASHSSTNNDKGDVALRYSGELSGIKIAGTVSYQQNQGTGSMDASFNTGTYPNRNYKEVNGGLGMLFKSGFNVYVSAGHRKFDRAEFKRGDMVTGKIGYQWKPFSIGQTSVAVDYGQWRDVTTPALFWQKFKAKAYGAYVAQNIEKVSTDVYLGVRKYSLSTHDVGGFEDIYVGMLGALVKF